MVFSHYLLLQKLSTLNDCRNPRCSSDYRFLYNFEQFAVRIFFLTPYLEFFWSVFSHIPTEYGNLLRKSPYSVRIQENTDQKNSECGVGKNSDHFPAAAQAGLNVDKTLMHDAQEVIRTYLLVKK